MSETLTDDPPLVEHQQRDEARDAQADEVVPQWSSPREVFGQEAEHEVRQGLPEKLSCL